MRKTLVRGLLVAAVAAGSSPLMAQPWGHGPCPMAEQAMEEGAEGDTEKLDPMPCPHGYPGRGYAGGQQAPMGYGPMHMGRPGGMGMGPGARSGGPEAMMEQRLEMVAERLEISEEQQEGWNSFAETMMAQVEQVYPGAGDRSGPPTLEDRIERMKGKAEAMTAMAEALESLVGILNEDQKAMFERFGMMMGR